MSKGAVGAVWVNGKLQEIITGDSFQDVWLAMPMFILMSYTEHRDVCQFRYLYDKHEMHYVTPVGIYEIHEDHE